MSEMELHLCMGSKQVKIKKKEEKEKEAQVCGYSVIPSIDSSTALRLDAACT